MSYIAPIHRPSSVRLAIRASLRSQDSNDLVLAIANRLEIWTLADTARGQSLVKVHTQVIHGTIVILQKLRLKESPTDTLFVGTSRFEYFTAGWDPDSHRLTTRESFVDGGEKHMRDAQSSDKCIVDPTGKFMAVHLWEGVLNVLRVSPRKGSAKELEWLEQVRLTELFIKSSTFLHSETGHPKIAFLWQPRSDEPGTNLAVYRLTADDKNTKSAKFDPKREREIELSDLDPGASLLIPVDKVEDGKRHNIRAPTLAKACLGGVIVVGETILQYVDSQSKVSVKSPLKEATIFVTWAQYDVTHYFLADDFGFLWLLSINVDGVEVAGMTVTKMGQISRASCLVYLDNSWLYVGSHQGKPQVLKVDPSLRSFEVVETFNSISPVVDFTVMDMGNREGNSQIGNEYSSGQARIVAGCGSWGDGVLNSIRSGVGLEDIGILAEFENVRGLYPVQVGLDPKVDALLISFPTETRAFKFLPSGDVEEVDSFQGISLATHTILIRQAPNDRIVQITPSYVVLVDGESGLAVAQWSAPGGAGITCASCNDRWVMLILDGKTVVCLDLQQDLALSKQVEVEQGHQVACVHLSPQYENVCVIGMWTGQISLVDVPSLNLLKSETIQILPETTLVPRDIALVDVLQHSNPTLFVAMSDGSVVNFSVSPTDFSLSGRKSVILGTRQSRFHLIPNYTTGTYSIFSTSEHPSLIYGSEGRIVYAAVTAEDATHICPFNSPAFPHCVVLATESVVKISRVDGERRTHVKPVPLGETIRRVAYSPKEKVFGLGCVKRELKGGEEVVSSSFRLVDEIVFGPVGKPFPLDDSPETELVEAVIRAELKDSYGNPAERFLVGTSYMDIDETTRSDGVNGRILVLGIDSEHNPYLIAQKKLKGSCRRLLVLGDRIVAILSKTVAVYSYIEETAMLGKISRVASYRPSTIPIALAIHGNTIAVGDLMKSMTLVRFTPGSGTSQANIVELARHYQSAWTTAVAHVQDEDWLEADADGNLMVLRRNVDGGTDDLKRRLEVTCEMNLGEQVNQIHTIQVETSPSAVVIPKAFLGTVEGGIYMYGVISQQSQDLLLRFQSKLERHAEVLGDLNFSQYRAFRNEEREAEGPYRFVDGELIERFLDIPEHIQNEICDGLGPSVEHMRNLVEELKRMH